MAKVSIIIPTYNVEIFLDECLESIRRQTLQDIEIICVNDGSTDHSLEIIRKYAENDPRFVIIDKENGGYGKAMNVGLDRATGEYIGIVEPDDYVPLAMYEDLYKIAKENDLDMVKADFYRFTRNSENGDMNLVYNHLDKTGKWYGKLFDPSEEPEAIRFIMNTWSGIYKREFLEQHHIRHNETPGASFQDNGFYFQTFIYAKRAMIVDKPYYMNRRDNPNSSVNNKEKVYCCNIEYDYIREILMKDPEIWNRFKYMYSLKKLHNYNFTLQRIGDQFKKEYVQRISREYKKAEANGELKQELFQPAEWDNLMLLIKDPEAYYFKICVKNKQIRSLEKKVASLENSTSMKVGRAIMFIPIKIKKLLKRK